METKTITVNTKALEDFQSRFGNLKEVSTMLKDVCINYTLGVDSEDLDAFNIMQGDVYTLSRVAELLSEMAEV